MPMTSTERSRKHRERLKSESARLVQVTLDADTGSILDDLVEQTRGTQSDVVTHALGLYSMRQSKRDSP